MQKAETILQIIQKQGEQGNPLKRVYRHLFNEEMYLRAYGKLYKNKGALTEGVTADTVDGMSMKRIEMTIEQMRQERYNFKPARRVKIPKSNGQTRALGLPTFTDKLVQEVVKAILEAYYEPQFSEHSHGFRPNRGCHSALKHIKQRFMGTVWYIEGDIRRCFDDIDHERLLGYLAQDIHDGRFLNLIRRMMKAGYLEEWQYHKTHSGTPQGGVVSPILANIYLHQLDQFYENVLQPKYNFGGRRQHNPQYKRAEGQMRRAYKRGDKQAGAKWRKTLRQMPTQNVTDPSFRRLKYVRYADDFLLGLIGTKEDAEAVKAELRGFLQTELGLELSDEKTKVTHARSKSARFLGYAIATHHANDKLSYNPKGSGYKVRSINGQQRLSIPKETIHAYCQPYQKGGKTVSQVKMTPNSVAEIVAAYQSKFRGIAEYYKYASNRRDLQTVKGVMQASLVKTLAHKLSISVSQVYRQYRATRTVDGYTYKVLLEKVEANDKLYHFYWGGIPLRVQQFDRTEIEDVIPNTNYASKSELVQRLSADTCEQCGAKGNVEVHHVRKLRDLKQQWRGKEKPTWVQFMAARNRKTIVLCRDCHLKLHRGELH